MRWLELPDGKPKIMDVLGEEVTNAKTSGRVEHVWRLDEKKDGGRRGVVVGMVGHH